MTEEEKAASTPAPQPAATASTPAAPPPAAAAEEPKPSIGKSVMDSIMERVSVTRPKKVEPTAEEVAAKAAEKKKAEDEAASAEKEKAEKAKKSEKPEEKPEEKPVTKPSEKRPRVRHVLSGEKPSAGSIAEIAAKAAVAAVAATQPEKKAETKEAAIPEMFSQDADIYEQLEKNNPAKYGEGKLVKMLARSSKQINDYRAAWETDNPGQQFVEEDHADKLKEFAPKIPERERSQALVDVQLEERMKPQREAAEKDKSKKESEELDRQLDPVADQASSYFENDLAGSVDPEFLNVLKTKDNEKIKAYYEENAPIVEIARAAFNEETPVIKRMSKLMTGDPRKIYNKNDPLDVRIFSQIIPELERVVIGQTDDDGRTFVTAHQYASMSPTEQSDHTYLTRDLAVMLYSKVVKNNVNAKIERIKNYASTRVKRATGGGKAPESAPAAAKVSEEKPGETSTSSRSGSPGAGPTVGDKPISQSGSKSVRDAIFDRMMS